MYNGQKLKRLLEQRWTGHLATVTVIIKSFNSILSLLQEIEDEQTSSTEIRVEATGLLKAITQPSFHFISCMIHKVLSLLDPPNTLLQAHTINLFTGVSVVQSALKCVEELRCDNQFDMLWEEFHKKREEAELPAVPGQKRRREESTQWKDYVVDTTFGQTRMEGEKTECKRLYFSILDAVVGEMSTRFCERNSKFIQVLSALHPRSAFFMDGDKVKPLLDLTGMEFKEAEFSVAQQFLRDEIAKSDENCTTASILQRYNDALSAMPTVLQTLKLGLTFGASTATCES